MDSQILVYPNNLCGGNRVCVCACVLMSGLDLDKITCESIYYCNVSVRLYQHTITSTNTLQCFIKNEILYTLKFNQLAKYR